MGPEDGILWDLSPKNPNNWKYMITSLILGIIMIWWMDGQFTNAQKNAQDEMNNKCPPYTNVNYTYEGKTITSAHYTSENTWTVYREWYQPWYNYNYTCASPK